MLQIKKSALLTSCKYNLQFLFRNKMLSNYYKAKKQTTQAITLRSPKHFNIGKHKVLTLNYKTPKFIINFKKKIMLTSLLKAQGDLLSSVSRALLITPTLSVKSVRLTVKTKFKLKWLEI